MEDPRGQLVREMGSYAIYLKYNRYDIYKRDTKLKEGLEFESDAMDYIADAQVADLRNLL